MVREFGLAPLVDGSAPFFAYVGVNPINPDAHNLSIGLSGLGLPDRDYYFDDTERFAQIRGDYLQYIALMLDQAGYQASAVAAQQVLDLLEKDREMLLYLQLLPCLLPAGCLPMFFYLGTKVLILRPMVIMRLLKFGVLKQKI